jgi:DNA-binding transcriptional MerR regulator
MAVDLVDNQAMGISEVAERTGLTQDTLRWYEREGMIPPVTRGTDRRRRYDDQSVQRIELLVRLRATGMPTSEMREFAELLSGGIETHRRRLEILLAHRARIVARQQRLAECLHAVDSKIDFYRRSEREES